MIKPRAADRIEAAFAFVAQKMRGGDGARPTVREDGGDFLRGLRTRYRRRSLARSRSVGPNWVPTVVARLFCSLAHLKTTGASMSTADALRGRGEGGGMVKTGGGRHMGAGALGAQNCKLNTHR